MTNTNPVKQFPVEVVQVACDPWRVMAQLLREGAKFFQDPFFESSVRYYFVDHNYRT